MLNPILYTEQVFSDLLRYQLAICALADRELYAEVKTLLSLDETRTGAWSMGGASTCTGGSIKMKAWQHS